MFSLEQDAEYAKKVQKLLFRYGIKNVNLFVAPIVSYSTFDWYHVPPAIFEEAFDLVICDGPAGPLKGGRVGLVPVLINQLRRPCIILLDDVDRESERRALEVWSTMVECKVSCYQGGNRMFGVVELR